MALKMWGFLSLFTALTTLPAYFMVNGVRFCLNPMFLFLNNTYFFGACMWCLSTFEMFVPLQPMRFFKFQSHSFRLFISLLHSFYFHWRKFQLKMGLLKKINKIIVKIIK